MPSDSLGHYPRDLIGYGRKPPQANWPGRAKIALQFVLNYEEGGENHVLHGDPSSEQFLSEIVGEYFTSVPTTNQIGTAISTVEA